MSNSFLIAFLVNLDYKFCCNFASFGSAVLDFFTVHLVILINLSETLESLCIPFLGSNGAR